MANSVMPADHGQPATLKKPTPALPDHPALRSARLGARAYELMNSGIAVTFDDLVRELGTPEVEIAAGIHAYLFVTTGCDLSQDTPRSTKRLAAVAA